MFARGGLNDFIDVLQYVFPRLPLGVKLGIEALQNTEASLFGVVKVGDRRSALFDAGR